MQKFGLGVLAALVLSAGVTYTAQKTDDQVMREVRDRAEIEDLMWRYTRALDTTDAAHRRGLYAGWPVRHRRQRDEGPRGADENGRGPAREPGGERGEGRAESADVSHDRKPCGHLHRQDHARVDAYYLTAFGPAGQETPLRVAAVGRSVDELVRVNGRWLIKTRNVAPQN